MTGQAKGGGGGSHPLPFARHLQIKTAYLCEHVKGERAPLYIILISSSQAYQVTRFNLSTRVKPLEGRNEGAGPLNYKRDILGH